LPVELVVRDIAVDEEVQEVAGSHPPVHVQRLGEEACREQAGPARHPALVAELPQGRVDDGVARTALLPGFDLLRGAAPAVVPGAVVVVCRVGAGRQDLVVEVPPGELADEGMRPGAVLCAGPVQQLGR
jgi:hypothetical protein